MNILDQIGREAEEQDKKDAIDGCAKLMGDYYKALLKHSLPADLAQDLIRQYHSALLQPSIILVDEGEEDDDDPI